MSFRLLAVALACAACTPESTGPRSVHLESASALYTEARPDGGSRDEGLSAKPEVTARILVDGRQLGTCSKRWFHFEMACKLDVDAELREDSRIELIVADANDATADRMGAGTLERAGAKIPQRGRATIALVPHGSVTAASLSLEARWVPRVSTESARALVVFAGLALAFVLYGLLRRRFLTVGDQFGRSVAVVTAGLATLVAWVMLLPVADHAATLEPLVVTTPMGLGSYALTAVTIDGVVARQAGRRRIQIGLAAIAAVVAMPLAMAVSMVSPKFTIIAVVVIALVLFT